MSIAVCLMMVTSISAPITQNVGQSQIHEQSGPSPTSGGSGGLANSPWPMFRQNLNHTGVSAYDTSLNPGKLKWSFTTGSIVHSSPAIGIDGTVYIGSYDNNLYAVNPDGTEKWNFTASSGLASSPAIDADGTIYVGSWDKNLYAINPNGIKKWSFTSGGAIDSSPAISPDGTIYAGSYDDKLYAINPDGSEKWNFTTGLNVRTSPAIDSDGTIYIGSLDFKLYAINPDGTEKWNIETGSYVEDSSPAIGPDGTIYVGSRDNKLYAINPNGTVRWTYITGDEVCSSPAIGSDGTIYFGSQDNKFYAINPNGTKKWSFNTGGWVFSSPAIGSDGTIYVGSCDDNLYAINPDGTLKWNFTAGWYIVSSPAIGSDGTIYVGSHDKMLYAIGTPSNLNVSVTSHFSDLNSAAQSSITVHVTDGINPVQGATVNLVSDNGGIFSPQSGITDAIGDFTSIFNAPTVTSQIICKISAEASKTGYNDGSGYVDVTLNPIPWPMFNHNCRHTGLSPYDTSSNPGKLKWNFTTNNIVISSPTIGSDGTIYIGSWDNKLYAINPDGTEKWNFTTGHYIRSSPAISSDGTIYVGSGDNNLYAINPDGTEKWSFTTGSYVTSDPAIGSDGTIYAASTDGKLYAINPDGSEKWNFNTGLGSSPAIGSDGTIYIGSGTARNKLYAINLNGTEKWSFTTGSYVLSPAIGYDGTIYVGSGDHKVYAINPDGTEKWNFRTGREVISSPGIGSDGTVYTGSHDNKLYAINSDGIEKWSFATGSYVGSSPAIGSDGTIFVGSNDNKLYAINPDGTEGWNFTTGNLIKSSPAIGSDGTIYIGSWDNKLYAIGSSPLTQPPIANAGPDQTVNEGDVVQFDGSGSTGSIGQSLDSNIVALWHMNESTGNIIYDETDNHNDGTIHGASWIGGKFKEALSFDGINDYVEIPDDDSLDDMLEISIEAWIYLLLDTVEKKVIIAKDSGTYNSSYGLRFDFPNRLQFYVFNETDSEWVAYTLPSISNEWFYVVGTYDGETVRLFLNGTEVGTRNGDIAGKIQNSNAQVCIGRYSSLNSGFFNGIIDEVVIRNRAFSAQNILDYYNSGKEHFIEEELSPSEPAEIISYEWDFESDGIYDYVETMDNVPDGIFDGKTNHTYGDDGIYKVTLRITDDQNLTDIDTCNITVQNVDPTITIESLMMEVEIGLRIAGRKYNNVSMALYEDGSLIGNVSIERLPGSPNEQMAWIPVSINFSKSYNATVTYTPKDPPNVGANPVWIYIKSKNGRMNKIHHTFNVQQSKKRDSDHWNHVEPWEVDLNEHFIGLSFEISSHITDPGSDDEILTFTYGSQTITVTHLNNHPNPDPYPSPEVKPVDIMDTTTLVYEGPGTVTLVVKDDDNIRLGVGEGIDYLSLG